MGRASTMAALGAPSAALSPLSGSPANVRAGAAARRDNLLEESLKSLLVSTQAVTDGCKDASKDCSRVRRKSKDLSEVLTDMAEQCESLAGAARVWRSLALGDGDAADLTDEALRKAFDSIDADLSGTIEEGEL